MKNIQQKQFECMLGSHTEYYEPLRIDKFKRDFPEIVDYYWGHWANNVYKNNEYVLLRKCKYCSCKGCLYIYVHVFHTFERAQKWCDDLNGVVKEGCLQEKNSNAL